MPNVRQKEKKKDKIELGAEFEAMENDTRGFEL